MAGTRAKSLEELLAESKAQTEAILSLLNKFTQSQLSTRVHQPILQQSAESGQKQPVRSAPSLPFYTTPLPSPFPPFESHVPFRSSPLQQFYYSPYDQHQTSHNYAPSTSSLSANYASDRTLSSNSQHSSEQYAPFGSSVSHVYEDPYENAVKFIQGSGSIDDKYGSYNQSKSGFGLDLYGRRMDNGVTRYESSYDDGYRDDVFAYQGSKAEPDGARGTSPNSSTWTGFDDYGRPISFPAEEEPSSGSSKIVRAIPKADTQEDLKGEIIKFNLAGDNLSSDLHTSESEEDAASGESEYEVDMDKDELDDAVYEGDAPVEIVPETEKETHLLAVFKMDGRYIKPEHLYLMLSSFLPTGGQILCISISTSEFGLRRMKEETVHGQVGCGAIDDEILRSYELSRLRYYYAVVECDSVATADYLYKTCDGVEFERSSNVLDLRFFPDSVEHKHPPRDIATLVPGNYEAIDFHTSTLHKSKVDSSMGEDLPDEYKWADYSILTRLPWLSLILIKAALGSSWNEILCGEQILEGKRDLGRPAIIVSSSDILIFKILNYKSTRKKLCYKPQLCVFLDGRNPNENVLLLIESGVRLHTTAYIRDQSNTPSGFTLKLRKNIRTRRLVVVRQLGYDRIVLFQFGLGASAHYVMLELYAQGNILLTELLRDMVDCVRSAAFRAVTAWGLMLVASSSEDTQYWSDDRLVKLSFMTRDMSVEVRVEAFKAMEKIELVSGDILLQSISKRVLDISKRKKKKSLGQFPAEVSTANTTGAFVHGVDDEYSDSACHSIRKLTILSAEFASEALNLLMDILNDDSLFVRWEVLANVMDQNTLFTYLLQRSRAAEFSDSEFKLNEGNTCQLYPTACTSSAPDSSEETMREQNCQSAYKLHSHTMIEPRDLQASTGVNQLMIEVTESINDILKHTKHIWSLIKSGRTNEALRFCKLSSSALVLWILCGATLQHFILEDKDILRGKICHGRAHMHGRTQAQRAGCRRVHFVREHPADK